MFGKNKNTDISRLIFQYYNFGDFKESLELYDDLGKYNFNNFPKKVILWICNP